MCVVEKTAVNLSTIFKAEFEINLFTSMKKNKNDRSCPRLYFTISGTRVTFPVKVAKLSLTTGT